MKIEIDPVLVTDFFERCCQALTKGTKGFGGVFITDRDRAIFRPCIVDEDVGFFLIKKGRGKVQAEYERIFRIICYHELSRSFAIFDWTGWEFKLDRYCVLFV